MKKAVLGVLLSLGVQAQADGILSLDDYLTAVRSRNEAYQAAKEAQEAARLYRNEGRLQISPVFFSTLQFTDDASPSPTPVAAFSYDKVLRDNLVFGIEQQTTFGLTGKFSYLLNETEYVGWAAVDEPYTDARPVLELSQSLWRNDFGREVRAHVTAATQGAKATEHQEAFNRQNLIVEAESAYWRLALARENHELAAENLKRSERIHGWARRRVQLSLADRSDLLQAQAGLEIRQLELQVAETELRAASLSFNSARGANDDLVSEKLLPLSKEVIGSLKIPDRLNNRQDLLAAEAQAEALKARATLSREQSQPTLDIFGSYAFNARETSKSDAFSNSWDGDLPTKVIGLKLRAPLNFGTVSDVQRGYERQAKAAELQLSRKRFVQEQEWRDLILRFNETKTRLAAIESLEKAQRAKLEFERQRQERGRTTLFQVLTFETDYLASQNQRLRTLAELLQMVAKMKLYGVNNESR